MDINDLLPNITLAKNLTPLKPNNTKKLEALKLLRQKQAIIDMVDAVDNYCCESKATPLILSRHNVPDDVCEVVCDKFRTAGYSIEMGVKMIRITP